MVDADNAAVLGGSYGGYMVNAVLAEHPGVFKAGVSLFGVADWVTALEIASPALKAADRIEFGDITEDKWREFYKVNSPIRKADQITVPVLYSHGVKDPLHRYLRDGSDGKNPARKWRARALHPHAR